MSSQQEELLSKYREQVQMQVLQEIMTKTSEKCFKVRIMLRRICVYWFNDDLSFDSCVLVKEETVWIQAKQHAWLIVWIVIWIQ
jgi:hypothetical protein